MKNNTISVIVPIHNEENNLLKLSEDLLYLHNSFNHYGIDATFLLIDDFSSDNSWLMLEEIFHKYSAKIRLECIKNNENIGFASTILKGFALSTTDFLMILPGDAEVDVKTISNFDIQDYDLVIYERGNISSRPILRIIFSYLFRLLVSYTILRSSIDFNGIYIIRKSVLSNFQIKSNSFFISAEVIAKSLMYTSNFTRESFDLYKKDIYKSSSLNFSQFMGVVRGFVDLTLYRIWFFLSKLNP